LYVLEQLAGDAGEARIATLFWGKFLGIDLPDLLVHVDGETRELCRSRR
jgi:hypothetical protein